MTFIEERESLKRLHDEVVPIGEVSVTFEAQSRDTFGRRYEKRSVIVGDESDQDPALRQWYFERTNQFESMIQHNPQWMATHLGNPKHGEDPTKLYIDERNIPAMDLYYQDGRKTQMFEWGHQMKKAIALEPLQNLHKGGRFLTLGRLDRRTLERFTYMPDGIGLRSRQHIYADLLVKQAEKSEGDALRIVSLGSGASVPNIEASQKIEQQTGKHVDWQLFDLDPEALMHAYEMTSEAKLSLSTFDFGPLNHDPQKPGFKGRSYIEARHVEHESLDAVDALGLWEYLSDNQGKSFLQMMYPKLKPGAAMIISNMRKKRPHPQYNMVAVGWPDVIMRSDEDLLGIVDKAGIPTELVRITTPSDGVYAVMEIRKP
ncbi:MAG: hypothetical protein EOT05_00315 [Candidatus Microsaccharimonas sossegonensis]|uniref:Class I SAM-dependent methyltransferase n=1 Tax=Candidatus Microsaccharimonas sossegonensis TaxID=2506948 RepID=A0A4Q0AGD9_9BACT|nr:MAG: hypothetical protein EOT05_00315 [Candidatus Microsaccharimonas sossegonensis]